MDALRRTAKGTLAGLARRRAPRPATPRSSPTRTSPPQELTKQFNALPQRLGPRAAQRTTTS